MKQIIVPLLALCCLTGCAAESGASSAAAEEQSVYSEHSEHTGTYEQISQDEAKRLMAEEQNCIILDVRRQDEFDAGHIPDAVCIPNETITDTMPAGLPDRDQLILVYCRSGRRSKEAAQKLADMGYTNIKEFGGILDWDGAVVSAQ